MKLRILAVVAVGVLMSCGSGGSSGRALSGDITLSDLHTLLSDQVGGPCAGSDGFDDLHAGTAVVVKNAAGAVVATGQLGAGTRIGTNGSTTVSHQCRFPITVAGVPASDFYQVEVSHRGAQTYSRADLDTAGWQVHLTLSI